MKVAARLAVSQHAPAAVLFLAPALAFTFPLLLNMTTMLLGAPGDNMFWLGLLGWYAKSCGIGFAGMLNDTQLFYPLGVNLLPYAFLITLPLFSAARSVAGFGIVPLVCVSLLSSMGLDDWLRRVAGARISVRRRQMLAFFTYRLTDPQQFSGSAYVWLSHQTGSYAIPEYR